MTMEAKVEAGAIGKKLENVKTVKAGAKKEQKDKGNNHHQK